MIRILPATLLAATPAMAHPGHGAALHVEGVGILVAVLAVACAGYALIWRRAG